MVTELECIVVNIKVESCVERVYCLLYITLCECGLSCFLAEAFISGVLHLHKVF